MDDEPRCYWCDRPSAELHSPDGGRFAGSDPLRVPTRLSERERLAFVWCLECLRELAELRMRHDDEIAEAGVRV